MDRQLAQELGQIVRDDDLKQFIEFTQKHGYFMLYDNHFEGDTFQKGYIILSTSRANKIINHVVDNLIDIFAFRMNLWSWIYFTDNLSSSNDRKDVPDRILHARQTQLTQMTQCEEFRKNHSDPRKLIDYRVITAKEFMHICKYGTIQNLQYLLNNRYDFSLSENNILSDLLEYNITISRHKEVLNKMKLLLDCGYDPNTYPKDTKQTYPLIMIIRLYETHMGTSLKDVCFDIFKLLLQYGANPLNRDADGITALEIAPNDKIHEVLIEYLYLFYSDGMRQYGDNQLFIPQEMLDQPFVEQINRLMNYNNLHNLSKNRRQGNIEKPFPMPNGVQMSNLMRAAYLGYHAIMSIHFSRIFESVYYTCLPEFVEMNNLCDVAINTRKQISLFRHQLNEQDADGNTIAHHAAMGQSWTILKNLYYMNAKLSIANRDGKTPLTIIDTSQIPEIKQMFTSTMHSMIADSEYYPSRLITDLHGYLLNFI
jgi:ankyrin repeat protein